MAAFKLADLFVSLGLVDKDFKKGASQAEYSLSSLGKTAIGTAAGFIGAAGIQGAMRLAKDAIVGSIQSFAELEKSMAEVSTLVDTSVVSMSNLREGVIGLSRKYAQDPDSLAKALYQTISAGVGAADAIGFLETATKAAIGGVTDAKTAVDALTSIVNAYTIGADGAAYASDILFQTVKYGKTTLAELSPVIGQIAPLANAAGVNLEELGGAIASLTLSGLKTAEAGTALRGLLNSILSPSQDARKAANALGLDWSVAALKAKGLQGVLKELAFTTQGDTEAIAALIPEVRGMNAVLQLAGSQAESFDKILIGMGDSAGATDTAVEKMQDTLSFDWKMLTTEVKLFGEAFAEFLSPAIRGAVNILSKYLQLQREFVGILQKNLDAGKGISEEYGTAMRKQTKTLEDWRVIHEQAQIARKKEIDLAIKAGATMDNDRDGFYVRIAQHEKWIKLAQKEIEIGNEQEQVTKNNTAATKEQTEEEKKQLALIAKLKADLAAKGNREEDTEKEKAARERMALEELRAKNQIRNLEAVQQYEKQNLLFDVEKNQAIIDNEKSTNLERERAAINIHEIKKQLAMGELLFQKERLDAEYQLEKTKLEKMKGSTQSDLDQLKEIYAKAGRDIDQKFGKEIEKEGKAVIDLELKIQQGTFQRLSDEVVQNFTRWKDELKSGSTAAFQGLVSDTANIIDIIGTQFGNLGPVFSTVVNGIANTVSAALSGNPITTIASALSTVGTAIYQAGKLSGEAAAAEEEAARQANKAADAFLRSQGKADLSTLSPNEIREVLSEITDKFKDVGISSPEVAAYQGLVSKGFISPEGVGRYSDEDYATFSATEKSAIRKFGSTPGSQDLFSYYNRATTALGAASGEGLNPDNATSYAGAKAILKYQFETGAITLDQYKKQLLKYLNYYKSIGDLSQIDYAREMSDIDSATGAGVGGGDSGGTGGGTGGAGSTTGWGSGGDFSFAAGGSAGYFEASTGRGLDWLRAHAATPQNAADLTDSINYYKRKFTLLEGQFSQGDISADTFAVSANIIAGELDALASNSMVPATVAIELRNLADQWRGQGASALTSGQTSGGGGGLPSPGIFQAGNALQFQMLPSALVGTQDAFSSTLAEIADRIADTDLIPENISVNVNITSDGMVSTDGATIIAQAIGESIVTSGRAIGAP